MSPLGLGPVPPGECRREGCKAPVYWLKHERTGKTAPIDLQPSEDGNCEIDLDEGTYRIPGRHDIPLGGLRTNHWFTCIDPPPKDGKKSPSSRGRRSGAVPSLVLALAVFFSAWIQGSERPPEPGPLAVHSVPAGTYLPDPPQPDVTPR